MQMINHFKTVTGLALAGIENVIISDSENNYYEDSDFYYVGVNVKSNEFFKHVHSTTRFGGYAPLDKAIMISQLSEELQETIKALYIKASETAAIEHANQSSRIEKGDTVKVTNTRARYHKQASFTVDNITVYRDRFDRVQTVYLHGTDEQGQTVKTSATNCTVITHGEDKIKNIADRLRLGLRIK